MNVFPTPFSEKFIFGFHTTFWMTEQVLEDIAGTNPLPLLNAIFDRMDFKALSETDHLDSRRLDPKKIFTSISWNPEQRFVQVERMYWGILKPVSEVPEVN